MTGLALSLVGIIRALLEVAMLALLGQGGVALLAGAKRHTNPIHQLFSIVTNPVIRAARFITPRPIVDRHIPFVAFFLLFWLWIVLAWIKRYLASWL